MLAALSNLFRSPDERLLPYYPYPQCNHDGVPIAPPNRIYYGSEGPFRYPTQFEDMIGVSDEELASRRKSYWEKAHAY